jgi:hypothetical protein
LSATHPNQPAEIVVPSTLLDNMVRYVEVSSLTAKRAIDEVETHRQAQKRASDLRQPLLDHMVQHGVVAAGQKEAAVAMLGSHAETLQLLKAAVDKIVELKMVKKGGDPGTATDPAEAGVAAGSAYEKQGEYNSLTHPVVGHKTSFVKESDRPLLAQIGK